RCCRRLRRARARARRRGPRSRGRGSTRPARDGRRTRASSVPASGQLRLLDLVRVVLDLLLGLAGDDVDREGLLDAELFVDERDLVLARGELEIAHRRVLTGRAAVDED